MLGALAQSNTVLVTADQMKKALKMNLNKKFWEINLKAFDLGYEAANKG